MQKQSIYRINKQSFTPIKPQQPQSICSNKQNLKQLILNYLIKNLSQNKKNKKKNCQQSLKGISFVVQFINKKYQKIRFQYNGFEIVQEYVKSQKKNVYRQLNMEPLAEQIQSFLNNLQQLVQSITNMPCDKNLFIKSLIQKQILRSQKQSRIFELQQMKKKSLKAKENPFQSSDGFQHEQKNLILIQKQERQKVMSRETVTSCLATNQPVMVAQKSSNTSLLSQLIRQCNIFHHPQKLQALKRQRLNQVYSQSQVQRIILQQQQQNPCKIDKLQNKSVNIAQQKLNKSIGNVFDQDCLQFLNQWINQLTVSQKLYQHKLDHKNKHNNDNKNISQIVNSYQSDDQSGQDFGKNYINILKNSVSKDKL